jgi:hypothetical protein
VIKLEGYTPPPITTPVTAFDETGWSTRLKIVPHATEPCRPGAVSPWCAPPGTFQWEDVQRAVQSVQEVPTDTGLGVDILSVITEAGKYLDIVTGVLKDKALPDLAQRIRTISSINTAGPKAVTPPTDTSKPVNLDLQRFVKPLDAYIYYRRHTWILPVAISGGVLLLAGLGFGIGRWTFRSTSSKARRQGELSTSRRMRAKRRRHHARPQSCSVESLTAPSLPCSLPFPLRAAAR